MSFDEVQFIFPLLLMLLVAYLRVHCHIQGPEDFAPMFSSEFYSLDSYKTVISFKFICSSPVR